MQRAQRVRRDMNYQSEASYEAKSAPGVKFTIARVSLGRRIELTKRIRELAAKLEFLEAGEDPREKLEAAVLAREIERAYLRWGLVRVEGLAIDGEAATPEALVEKGPEELCREVLGAIRAECGLSEAESKN